MKAYYKLDNAVFGSTSFDNFTDTVYLQPIRVTNPLEIIDMLEHENEQLHITIKKLQNKLSEVDVDYLDAMEELNYYLESRRVKPI